jgi:hypothetical protein
MVHVVTVVHDFEVVHQVQMFVVDQYHQQKVLIVMEIVHHLFYDAHHVVLITVHIHQGIMNVVSHQVQLMLMLLILIPNKFVQHYENLFKHLLVQNVNEMIVLV